ncbi:hypothetical protein [Microbacterium sp. Se5.02b]|uniref:hypothetical protein n=1 Tax=Microbacterium sp. Se5.02b TaxID=2864103 RepID=UPI001C693B79|nr:hypothetical protein [Microbacterium sp. Se5.02b]QYM64019.1 hypothetical protein K1X59_18245 [Microbacterium sp. Se5.02b]
MKEIEGDGSMRRLRHTKKLLVASLVLVSVAAGAMPAQATDYWWPYATTASKPKNVVIQSDVALYIAGVKGHASGGGGWDVTFRIQTVSATASYLYNWGEAPGWGVVNYGFAQLGPNTARSSCLWKTRDAVTGSVPLSCSYLGTPQGQIARADSHPASPIPQLQDEQLQLRAEHSPFPQYVSDEFTQTYADPTLLQAENGVAYWSATDEAGNTCMIQAVDEGGLFGAACASDTDFASHGVGLALGSSDSDTPVADAYLFPESVSSAVVNDSSTDVTSRGSAIAAEVSGELVVLRGHADSVTVRGASGETYDVPGLG